MKISEDESVAAAATLSGLGRLGQVSVPPTLVRGSRGPAVTALQKFLNSFGYGLVVDGIFGAGTEAAVKAVQAKLKAPVTGKWTAENDAALRSVNQSGVVDATQTDKKAVVQAAVMAQPPPAVIAPTGQATPAPAPAPGVVPEDQVYIPNQSFADKLKVWMKSPWYWVGIAGVGVGLWWLWKKSGSAAPTAAMGEVEMLGLPSKRKSRKRKSKAKKEAA